VNAQDVAKIAKNHVTALNIARLELVNRLKDLMHGYGGMKSKRIASDKLSATIEV